MIGGEGSAHLDRTPLGLELTAANLCVEFASLKEWGGNCDN